jgi:hypothetical protein
MFSFEESETPRRKEQKQESSERRKGISLTFTWQVREKKDDHRNC